MSRAGHIFKQRRFEQGRAEKNEGLARLAFQAAIEGPSHGCPMRHLLWRCPSARARMGGVAQAGPCFRAALKHEGGARAHARWRRSHAAEERPQSLPMRAGRAEKWPPRGRLLWHYRA